MDHLNFVIDSSTAKTMAKNQGLNSVLQLLPLLLTSAQKLSRPPISGFAVAAIGLSSDDRVFIGVNVEFPKLPLHHSIHAEQFLITNLSRYPHTTLTHLLVSAFPCGHCRQFLQEIRGAPGIQVYVTRNNGVLEENMADCYQPLSDFLPHRFGPDDLLEKDVPLLLETHQNGLILKTDPIVQKRKSDLSDVLAAALDAANTSHAPYSRCPSGVALVDKEGNIYKGSYMESAAYNPSLGPAQAAVIDYIATTAAASRGRDEVRYESIVAAVLVEKEGAVVRQEETVRLFFMAVSPSCEFHVYHCKDCSSDVNGIAN